MRGKQSALPLLGISLLVLGAMGFFAVQSGMQRSETVRVAAPFTTFYEEQGGRGTFGTAISPAYLDEAGVLTQAFERAVLQLSIEGPQLAPLGLWLGKNQANASGAVDERFAPAYAELGGADFLGEAISEAYSSPEGDIRQDFERGQLVQGSGGVIRLGMLGSEWVASRPLSPAQIVPLIDGVLALPELRPAISVAQPALAVGETQTLYVYIQDAQGRPVEGAQIQVTLYLGESRAMLLLEPSDASGLSQASYEVTASPQGTRVLAQAQVLYRGALASTEATYLIWW